MDWRDEEQVVLRRIIALLWSLANLAECVPRGHRYWLLSLMQKAQAMTVHLVIDSLPPSTQPDAAVFAHPTPVHDAPLDGTQLGHGFRVMAWALAYLLASAPARPRFKYSPETPRAAIASGHPLAAINRRSRGPPPAALRD